MEQILGQIHVWQMAVDLLLVSSILIFTFRWIRGDRSQAIHPRTMELEASLRSLIQEADGAGRHLNDQLLKREHGLQKLIDESSAIEQKIQRAVASGEERAFDLEKEETKARALISELQGVLREFKEQLRSDASFDTPPPLAQAAPRAERLQPQSPPITLTAALEQEVIPRQRAAEQARQSIPQRATQNTIQNAAHPSSARPQSPAASYARGYASPQPTVQHGISASDSYMDEMVSRIDDEPSAAPATRSQQSQQPVQDSGYRSSGTNQVYREDMGHNELREVYAAAESMLKQGQELSHVSARTRLPVEEVQLLSQMVEIEREEMSKRKSVPSQVAQEPVDQRLGALGAIRRHNATV